MSGERGPGNEATISASYFEKLYALELLSA